MLVTGASSGIGEAAALYLAGLGHKVVGTSRNLDRLDALLSAGEGLSVIPLELDINSADAVSRAPSFSDYVLTVGIHGPFFCAVISPRGSRLLYKLLKTSDKRLAIFAGGFHTLIWDSTAPEVFALIQKWISERL